MSRAGDHESFHWSEARMALAPWLRRGDLRFDRRRGLFDGSAGSPGIRVRITPPATVPLPALLRARDEVDTAQAFARRVRARAVEEAAQGRGDLDVWMDALPDALPLQCVIFMQAGATSLAMMRAGEALATKSFKRYVTRGNGRSQSTFLKQKGKSRYGARLRLQNARRMLAETEERLLRLWEEHGEPTQVLVSAPKRLWAEFAQAARRLPFDPAEVRRVGLDVDVPTTDVLLRVCKGLEYGRIDWVGEEE